MKKVQLTGPGADAAHGTQPAYDLMTSTDLEG